MRILFICKKRQDQYGSFGLVNSARFVSHALCKEGIESKVVAVIDNNGIDREVHHYRPTHVIIEALWVVPDKFRILLPKYPKIKWIVRAHSDVPFLAHEGNAVSWIRNYNAIGKEYGNLNISANNTNLCNQLVNSAGINTIYSPNIYTPDIEQYNHKTRNDVIDIGCFGAIRPFKNHLQQAMVAITFANKINKKLRFHINSTRMEQRGEQVLSNVRALFDGTYYELVEHTWVSHENFLKIVAQMDLGMQVSMSESFNIVSADFVYQNVPIVVSPEISWMPWIYQADPNSEDSILRTMYIAYYMNMPWLNRWYLSRYNKKALKIWLNWLIDT